MLGYYILGGDDGLTPVAVDVEAWFYYFATHDRRVARTEITPDVEVSTVFLGLDHNFENFVREEWEPEGPPHIFETMVFRGGRGEKMRRYPTWAEALQGHLEMVEQVRRELAMSGRSAEEARDDNGTAAPRSRGARRRKRGD